MVAVMSSDWCKAFVVVGAVLAVPVVLVCSMLNQCVRCRRGLYGEVQARTTGYEIAYQNLPFHELKLVTSLGSGVASGLLQTCL